MRAVALAHWEKAILFAIPMAIALTNRLWLCDPIGDVDTWIYNGYFKALRVFAENREAWGKPEYFETRLPVIVPGAIAYGLFSEGVAKVVFNLCLMHGVSALSFWHVVRTHTSRHAATVAAAMLVGDTFYLRAIGWDYIDNAVLTYQLLSFALLTTAGGRALSPGRTVGVGFTVMSMLATNAGSALWLPLMAIYRVAVVRRPASRGDLARDLGRLFGWAAIGGALCLGLYGALSRFALRGPFFFWIEQLRGGTEIRPHEYSVELGFAAWHGVWLSAHATALVVAAAALVLQRRRIDLRTPFARFCVWTTLALYPAMIVGEGLKRTFFLARAGVYATHFLGLTYFTIAAVLLGTRPIRSWIAGVALVTFPAFAIAKLSIHDGNGLGLTFPIPMVAVAGASAAALALAATLERPRLLAGALVLVASATLFLPYPFRRYDDLFAARNFILEGGTPPKVLYAEHDPQRQTFVSIASALTLQVVHDHYDRPEPIPAGTHVAVLHSVLADDPLAPCTIAGLRPVGRRTFAQPYYAIAVELFEATSIVERKDIRCGDYFAVDPRFEAFVDRPAEKLTPVVGRREGDAIVVSEGDGVGSVTAPYVDLEPGTYRLTIDYSTTKPRALPAPHRWEIVGLDRGEYTWLANAWLPDTDGERRSLAVSFRIPRRITYFLSHVRYAGTGELSVWSQHLGRLKPPGS